MITVVDVETSFVTGVNGKSDPSPFDSRNKFVESIIKNSVAIDVRTPFENKMTEWIKYFSQLEIQISNLLFIL